MAKTVSDSGLNNWHGSGNGPNIGTDNNPSQTSVNGYNNSPPESTPLNVPTGSDDYTNWNWEQILNAILGLSLPSRDDVKSLRWTATETGGSKPNGGPMSPDSSLYMIFEAVQGFEGISV